MTYQPHQSGTPVLLGRDREPAVVASWSSAAWDRCPSDRRLVRYDLNFPDGSTKRSVPAVDVEPQ